MVSPPSWSWADAEAGRPMPFLELPNGRRLAFGAKGAGEPLILVHGSPGEGRSWAKVAPSLASSYLVLTPDLPGYGKSDPLPLGVADHTAAMAEAIIALIDAQDGRVRLAGHSYGGNVAIHAALARQDKIRDLALFESVFFRALALNGAVERLAEARRFFLAYVAAVDAGRNEAVEDMVDYWFGDGAFGRMPAPIRDHLRKGASANAADVRATFAETLTREALADFDKPVRLVLGGSSPAIAG
ncbi:MAG: alpha/beta fold hydrolase, partial [Alphaproteobacteria bacterium]|nr:alpha/beta fold hydrolase [Alphaproteobacteria bacterium]